MYFYWLYKLYFQGIQVVFTAKTSYALKIFMRIKLYKTGEIGKMGLVYSCVYLCIHYTLRKQLSISSLYHVVYRCIGKREIFILKNK